MKSPKLLIPSERTKMHTFHDIHFYLHAFELVCKDLMSNPDPDFICCLSHKLETFIQNEVLPLAERHYSDITTSHDASVFVNDILNDIDKDETDH